MTDKLIPLSEQELVDCDTNQDHGCHGGLMDFAFEFIKQNGGLDTEKDYKYTAEEDQCSLKKEHRRVVSIDGYEDVPGSDEQSLLKVQLFPVSTVPQRFPFKCLFAYYKARACRASLLLLHVLWLVCVSSRR